MKAPRGFVVDHINFNGLDNRKANLRIITQAQNVCHRRKIARQTVSQYKGIYWEKNGQRWRARIVLNRKNIYLGGYKDEFEAAKAYDKGAKKYHGEFATLNFPDDSR